MVLSNYCMASSNNTPYWPGCRMALRWLRRMWFMGMRWRNTSQSITSSQFKLTNVSNSESVTEQSWKLHLCFKISSFPWKSINKLSLLRCLNHCDFMLARWQYPIFESRPKLAHIWPAIFRSKTDVNENVPSNFSLCDCWDMSQTLKIDKSWTSISPHCLPIYGTRVCRMT